MIDMPAAACTAFHGPDRLATGTRAAVALAVRAALAGGSSATFLVFDDATGHELDFDLRGTDAEVVARLAEPAASDPAKAARGPGRPKLGVVAREVTLLPRHWDWLAAQPGGASVTLRRLVEEARRGKDASEPTRASKDAAYRFMSAMAGNLPGFEEAARALYAGDRARFDQYVASWPRDIRAYAAKLAFGGEPIAA